MQPLRILQIVPSISLVYGGPSQMVLSLSKELAAQGAAVTVLTTTSNGDVGQPPLDVPIDRPIEQAGYQIRYFRCSPFRRYKFSLGLLHWLARHAHEFDIAHIHALFSPVSTAAATIARARNLPYILRPLGTLDPADLQKKRHLKQLYALLLERSNLAGAAAVHFTSDQEAKISERFGVTTRDLVMPLGVERWDSNAAIDESVNKSVNELINGSVNEPANESMNEFVNRSVSQSADRSLKRPPVILFMSRIDRKKGLDLLLPALKQLQTEGVAFHLVLAGANPQDPGYEQQIRETVHASTLADRTTFTGFVSGSAKAKLLQAADLFVLPSYYENFGIAVAEAMAAGVPVVISDRVHIWQEIQQAEAGWVCPCDVTALADQLRLALQDAADRQRRGNNAQAHAQTHYSWEAIAQQMLQAYNALSAGG